jgi:hypothetical protein
MRLTGLEGEKRGHADYPEFGKSGKDDAQRAETGLALIPFVYPAQDFTASANETA